MPYDAIVVGARCAGAPTAMLLAERGHRVLLVDRATFPSDTMSTHVLHPPAVAALDRWGLLDRVLATGLPPIRRYSFDFGPLTIAGTPRPADGQAAGYAPRRTVLDELLVAAAAEAGAEVRLGCSVDELIMADGRVAGVRMGDTVERARVVVGADGRHSVVAKAVLPAEYDPRPSRMAMYYAYWSDLPTDGFETFIRAGDARGFAAAGTNDGLAVVPFGWPIDEFKANRGDIEGHFWRAVALAPEFEERMRTATRESRFVGTAELPGYFRVPYGPGWALIGDAGYHKNPITAMGISDAFLDAEHLATALDATFTGTPYDGALAAYQQARDERARPVYAFTDDFAMLAPPPPELAALLGAMAHNQAAMDDFVSVQAGTLPAPEFFAPENLGRIMAGSAA